VFVLVSCLISLVSLVEPFLVSVLWMYLVVIFIADVTIIWCFVSMGTSLLCTYRNDVWGEDWSW